MTIQNLKPSEDNTTISSIYAFDEKHDGRIEGYATYARLIRGIIAALYKRYGIRYELYASDDPNSEYWSLLDEDLRSESPDVELVARIFEDLELRTLHYDDDDGDEPSYGVQYSIRNNVFAYPKWGVALVRIPFSAATAFTMKTLCLRRAKNI